MSNYQKYFLFIHHVINNNEPVLKIEFEFKLSDDKFYYSFLRPSNELLSVFIKRIVTKLNQIKYKRSSKKLKKNQNIIPEISILKVLDENNIEIEDDISLSIFIERHYKLSVNEIIYEIWEDPLWITTCALPDDIIVDCPILPLITVKNGDIKNLTFKWFVQPPDSKEWFYINNLEIWTPLISFKDNLIKLEVISPTNIKQQTFELTSKSRVKHTVFLMKYNLEIDLSKISLDKSDQFSLCSYNILAAVYADSQNAKSKLFRHCKSKFLSSKYRYPMILGQIIQFKNDIYCLQEVDQKFYEKHLTTILDRNCYQSLFQMKDSKACEGSTIIWREDIFELVENVSIKSFGQVLEETNDDISDNIKAQLALNKDLEDHWLRLGQSASCVVLLHKSTDKLLIIANNHLFYNPNYEMFRVLQAYLLCKHLGTVLTKYPTAALIIAGDFNTSFEDPTIQFIQNGSIKYPGSSIVLNHRLPTPLHSIFKDKISFTNFVLDYQGILDHIFHSPRELSVLHTQSLPTQEDILKYGKALPNSSHPSDHLPLICQMKFNQSNCQ